MKQFTAGVVLVIPFLLIIIIAGQLRAISRLHPEPAICSTVLDTLRTTAAAVEKAGSMEMPNYSSPPESGALFSKKQVQTVPKAVHRPVAQISSYVRTPLQLQGILKGSSPIAVIIDPSGNSHFLKIGESLLGRKVTAVNSGGVVLTDSAGVETLAIP